MNFSKQCRQMWMQGVALARVSPKTFHTIGKSACHSSCQKTMQVNATRCHFVWTHDDTFCMLKRVQLCLLDKHERVHCGRNECTANCAQQPARPSNVQSCNTRGFCTIQSLSLNIALCGMCVHDSASFVKIFVQRQSWRSKFKTETKMKKEMQSRHFTWIWISNGSVRSELELWRLCNCCCDAPCQMVWTSVSQLRFMHRELHPVASWTSQCSTCILTQLPCIFIHFSHCFHVQTALHKWNLTKPKMNWKEKAMWAITALLKWSSVAVFSAKDFSPCECSIFCQFFSKLCDCFAVHRSEHFSRVVCVGKGKSVIVLKVRVLLAKNLIYGIPWSCFFVSGFAHISHAFALNKTFEYYWFCSHQRFGV